MTWTVTNLVIQIITGILAAHAAAAVVKEHSFGWLGHTIAGAAGGRLSGYFLQTFAATVVTASGSLNQPTLVENAIGDSVWISRIGLNYKFGHAPVMAKY